MPLSYKIVLGSVALLCLVVIGFKAVSSGDEDPPQIIAASQPNQHDAGNPNAPVDEIASADAIATNTTDVSAATAGTPDASTTTNNTEPITNVQPESNSSVETNTTPAHDGNLADVTRALATEASTTNENVTHAAPVSESSTTTQVADASNANQDGEDKGLDDLLARIRQYEADVLGDEPKVIETVNDSIAATSANVESTDVNTVAAVTDTVATSTEPSVAINDTNDTNRTIENNALDNNTDTSNEVTIPDVPPVVTIGRGAPIQQLADNDTKSDGALITPNTSNSNDTTNEDKIAAAVFDPPAVVGPTATETNAAAKSNSSDSPTGPIVEPKSATQYVTPVIPATQPGTYTIKPGDTFSSIAVSVFGAERHWLAIADANPKVDSRRMRVGQVIKLPDLTAASATTVSPSVKTDSTTTSTPTVAPTPSKDSHVVRAGETLWAIAKEHYGKGELWHHLYKTNRDVIGSKPGNVRAGMTLRIAALPVNR